jgi:hypothetical protein
LGSECFVELVGVAHLRCKDFPEHMSSASSLDHLTRRSLLRSSLRSHRGAQGSTATIWCVFCQHSCVFLHCRGASLCWAVRRRPCRCARWARSHHKSPRTRLLNRWLIILFSRRRRASAITTITESCLMVHQPVTCARCALFARPPSCALRATITSVPPALRRTSSMNRRP